MPGRIDRFALFVADERSRLLRRGRFAGILSVLVGVLLWRTQWPALRPGLAVVLAGQAGLCCALSVRAARWDESSPHVWFPQQQSFLNRLAAYEAVCHWLGFALLGYGLWMATGLISLALLIGFVYPAAAWFGIVRPNQRRARRRLAAEQQRIPA